MKKEEAYRDKNANYVAFVYDGHVFVLKTIKGTANGKTWTNPRYAFCPISSDTEFGVRFTTVEEAIVAVEKIWLKPIYTRHWEELEESFPGVDKLKWKEWHEYQEVLRHKAPFAAIAVGNRVYKDTYSTALSDGSAWVFSTGVERLFKYPIQATHKIDQLLIAVSQYPDMKLFDTVEERTEWSLKYLEEYAAKPEPTSELPPGSVVEVSSHTHVVTPTRVLAAAPPNSTTELPPVGLTNVPRNSCIVHAFESQGTPKLRPVEIAELPPASVIEVDSYKSADVFISTATDNTTPTATSVLTTDGPGSSWDVVDNNGMPHGVDAARKFLTHVTASSDPYILKASPGSEGLTADSSIKTMKSGVTPQPSRSRIGKIAAQPYEYVYDGPQQMGTTFVSRYRIDDEVWVRVGHELVKMRVTGIYVEHEQGSTAYSYFLKHPTLTIGGRAESELYDTLFDLISAMTSISVEDLIAAAKEVV